MQISLEPVRRQRVTAHLQKLFASEFDETLSEFRAQQIIDMMIRTMGPAIYNQAVQDVRAHMQGKLDDLDGEVFADGDV